MRHSQGSELLSRSFNLVGAIIDFMRGVLNELSIHFSYLGYAEFPEAIRLLADGVIDPLPMITRVIPLDSVVTDGFEALARQDNQDVKVLVKI